MYEVVEISPQKASAILRSIGSSVKEFKRHEFHGLCEMLLPRGGKIIHTELRGYYLRSYSRGDCEV